MIYKPIKVKHDLELQILLRLLYFHQMIPYPVPMWDLIGRSFHAMSHDLIGRPHLLRAV